MAKYTKETTLYRKSELHNALDSAAKEATDYLTNINGGILVAKEGNTIGALVSADGDFEVVPLTWTADGKAEIGTPLAKYDKDSILLGSASKYPNIRLGDKHASIYADKDDSHNFMHLMSENGNGYSHIAEAVASGGTYSMIDITAQSDNAKAESARIQLVSDATDGNYIDVAADDTHFSGAVTATSGTFSGNVSGKSLSSSGNVTAQSMELSSSTPFIGFHYGNGTGDDTRIINDASGRLSVIGDLNVTGAILGSGGSLFVTTQLSQTYSINKTSSKAISFTASRPYYKANAVRRITTGSGRICVSGFDLDDSGALTVWLYNPTGSDFTNMNCTVEISWIYSG